MRPRPLPSSLTSLTSLTSLASLVLGTLLVGGCAVGQTPLVARQPLGPAHDSGLALAHDGAIGAIELEDESGSVGDACTLFERCPMTRYGRLGVLEARRRAGGPYGQGYVYLLTAPPGRYRLRTFRIYDEHGFERRFSFKDPKARPVIVVRPHAVTVVGDLRCDHPWGQCEPQLRTTPEGRRRVTEQVRWELQQAGLAEEERRVLAGWLPALERSGD